MFPYSSRVRRAALRERKKTVIKFFIYVQLYSLLKHIYICTHIVCISPISNWTCKNHMSGKSKAAASVCLLIARFYNFLWSTFFIFYLPFFIFIIYISLTVELYASCYISLNSLFSSHHIILYEFFSLLNSLKYSFMDGRSETKRDR